MTITRHLKERLEAVESTLLNGKPLSHPEYLALVARRREILDAQQYLAQHSTDGDIEGEN